MFRSEVKRSDSYFRARTKLKLPQLNVNSQQKSIQYYRFCQVNRDKR